jgi:large subunit ribosomal protein L29
MKAAELREQTVEELRDREKALAEKLFALRLQRVTGQLESPAKVREARRDLARVLTVLREMELGEQGS